MALSHYQDLLDDLVRDKDEVIASEDRDQAIADAVLHYSVDRPRAVVVDVVSAGGYRLALPAGWLSDFSRIVQLEWPVDDDAAELSLVDLTEVDIYRAPSGQQIRMPVSVSDGETVRLTYTAHHLVDAVDDTIPLTHRMPVVCFAASILCRQLAAYYTTEGEPSINADTVDHRTKSDRWRSLASDYLKRYEKGASVQERDGPVAAGAVLDLDKTDTLGGDRIWHTRRRR